MASRPSPEVSAGQQTPETFDSLYRDVTTKIFDRFGDDTVVSPGHGKHTTLELERPSLPAGQERGW